MHEFSFLLFEEKNDFRHTLSTTSLVSTPFRDFAMAVLPKVAASSVEANLLWSGSIGYLLALLISLALFCQLLFSFAKKFNIPLICNSKNNDEKVDQNKTPYILVMIYLISSIITSILFLTLETNTFVLFDCNFTHSRCLSAITIWPTFIIFNYIILSLIYLHRIYAAFKGSALEYNKWIYRLFLFSITVPSPVLLSGVYIPILNSMQIYSTYDMSTDLAYCAAQFLSDTARFKQGYIVISLTICVLQLINIIGILILFVKGLWSLNQQMILHYVQNHNISSCKVEPNHKEIISGPVITSISTNTDFNCGPSTPIPPEKIGEDDNVDDTDVIQSRHTITVGDVLDSWSKQKSAQREKIRGDVKRIVELHNLMKKQSVLVGTAIISTITLLISIGGDVDIILLSGYDIIVNSICVWMMLDSSKKYWISCKNYGICVCCYWKTNKMGM